MVLLHNIVIYSKIALQSTIYFLLLQCASIITLEHWTPPFIHLSYLCPLNRPIVPPSLLHRGFKFRRRRSSSIVHHYHLKLRVLGRPSSRPPPSTSQCSSSSAGDPSPSSEGVHHQPTQPTVLHPLRDYYAADISSQSWYSAVLDTWDPPLPESQLSSFCSRLDFIQLHRLFSIFGPTNSTDEATFDLITSQLSAFHRLLYNSDQPFDYPNYISPLSIFISALDSVHVPTVIDTGASKSLSPFRGDFITFRPLKSSITGIGAQSEVRGIGLVRWKLIDQHGVPTTIETEAYYVPSAKIRLYSPQSHFEHHRSGSLLVTWNEVKLNLPQSSSSTALSFPFNQFSRLPLMLQAPTDAAPQHAMLMEESLSSPFYANCLDPDCSDDLQSTFNVTDQLPPFDMEPPPASSQHILAAIEEERNVNLRRNQLELLGWHYRLGHVNMHSIQRLMHPSKAIDNADTSEALSHPVVIATRNKGTNTCQVPKCAACIMGKMERVSPSTTRTHGSDVGTLRRDDLNPGDRLSMDQYVVATKGRTLTNSSRDNDKYNGGTVFVDHASGKIFNYHQISLRAGETLVGKRDIERQALELGHTIRHFQADNGVFASEEFRADVSRKGQSIRFSGVGAKHQNGIAERTIKTISYLTRANLIHSALRWPALNDLELWPFAFDYCVYIWNNLPGSDGLAPEEKWSGSKFHSYRHVRRLHPWGCPAYVLDPKLQDGKRIPKWSPRSRQGKFVGLSPSHATNVALVLNPSSKRISPQFHVLFDDFFSTVRSVDSDRDPVLQNVDWDALIQTNGTERYFDPDDLDHLPPPVSDEWLDPSELPARRSHRQRHHPHRSSAPAPSVIDLTSGHESDDDDVVITQVLPAPKSEPFKQPSSTSVPVPPPASLPPEGGPSASEGEQSTSEGAPIPSIPFPQPRTSTHSEVHSDNIIRGSRTRHRQLNRKYFNENMVSLAEASSADIESLMAGLDLSSLHQFYTCQDAESRLKTKRDGHYSHNHFVQNLDWESSVAALAGNSKSFQSQQFFTAFEHLEDPVTGDIDHFHPLAFAAKASDEDNPRWVEATSGENSEGFWDAMYAEILTLTKIGAWEQVERTKDMHVIPSTWAFKIKRFPSGLVRKLKARFCVRGDMQQQGVDVFETYAPVVSWTTVRLLLILSVILDLKSTQVDYTAAFCQAPIDTDVYITLPQGWRRLNRLGLPIEFKENHVLKLKRSLYGLAQSPKNFFHHLKGNLEKCGFTQSANDPCLFISKEVICLVYVDDCLFFSPNQAAIDEMISKLKTAGMDLNIENDVAGFLGVLIHKHDNGTVELTQTGLIDRILVALGLEDCNPKSTPAPRQALGKDPDGTPFQKDFNYASVVGMLRYLTDNTRPELSHSVSQCARYTHFPTEKHSAYLKHIGRYLKGTRTKGLILNPKRSASLDIQCYVDADFAGLWNAEEEHDPHCLRSRSGYVIMVAGCPVLWKSTLQTMIALSTMESEYIALSTACRDLLPLQRVATEVASSCDIANGKKMEVCSTIWEDNAACLKLANLSLPYLTNKSKHMAIKYHWFREHTGKLWNIFKVDTKNQLADLFTKSLDSTTFEALRFRIMGW